MSNVPTAQSSGEKMSVEYSATSIHRTSIPPATQISGTIKEKGDRKTAKAELMEDQDNTVSSEHDRAVAPTDSQQPWVPASHTRSSYVTFQQGMGNFQP